jgi:polyisoprenoid-binding protein YceI
MTRKMLSPAATAGILALALVPTTLLAGTIEYPVDPVHSEVGFRVRHIVAKVPGRFDEFTGHVSVDPEKIESTLRIEGTVKTASVNTNNGKRDDHLRSPDFFDAENHPEITFVTKSVDRKKGDHYVVTADFTLLGVTREIPFDVEMLGFAIHPMTGTPTLGLELNGTVNRKDFGMVWNQKLDAGGLLLGEDVAVSVHIEGVVPTS